MSGESLAAVQAAWKRLVEEDLLDVRRLRPEVARSWLRCRERSLDPLQRREGVGTPGDLEASLGRKDELLRAARPSLEGLYRFVKGAGFQVILADEEGVVLELLCDDEAVLPAPSTLSPGEDWGEAARGTNAIGTAIAERRPVQISACEHYLSQHHSLTCSAAPIFDPDGELTGVLDISCDYRHASDHTLGMVVVAVKGIESQLRLGREAAGTIRRQYPHSVALLDQAAGHSTSRPHLTVTPHSAIPRCTFNDIIGDSPAIEAAKEVSRRAAACSCAVLISGESGTGKELLARAIHQAGEGGCRSFVVVNCTGLPEHLVARGLLLGDQVDRRAPRGRSSREPGSTGCTAFLRKVGDLSLPAQLKLLRVLRDLASNGSEVRIIASTQKELEAEVRHGRFNHELFRLLDVLRVRLAPLRERGDDLTLLCRHLAHDFAVRSGRDGVIIEEEFLGKIRSHRWPGNVRELENVLEWAVIRSGAAGVLTADLLDFKPLSSFLPQV